MRLWIDLKACTVFSKPSLEPSCRVQPINSEPLSVWNFTFFISMPQAVLYTPNTVIGWYRNLIAQKYNGAANRKKVGRPQISHEVIALVIRFKKENPRWGYQKITDQVVYLGFTISPSSVKNILLENGYDPEPDLMIKSTWHEFISSHLDVLAACGFFYRGTVHRA